jgi:hypothetical protein
MPFFAVLPVDLQRTFRLLKDGQYGANLDRIANGCSLQPREGRSLLHKGLGEQE